MMNGGKILPARNNGDRHADSSGMHIRLHTFNHRIVRHQSSLPEFRSSRSRKPSDPSVSARRTLEKISTIIPEKIIETAMYLRSLAEREDVRWVDFMISAGRMKGWLGGVLRRLEKDLLKAEINSVYLSDVENISEILLILVVGWRFILSHEQTELSKGTIDSYRGIKAAPIRNKLMGLILRHEFLDALEGEVVETADIIKKYLNDAHRILSDIATLYP